MTSPKFDINEIRIAAPCPVGWETMKGDERKRHCDLCSLNVYNISEMTRAEAKTLIRNSEGRFCARVYRRADGTVITKDCPVGIRAYRKKIAAIAGAALSMVLGLFSAGFGQSDPKKQNEPATTTGERKNDNTVKNNAVISGKLTDDAGKAVPNTPVILILNGETDGVTQLSAEDGRFSFSGLKPGIYTLEVPVVGGFKRTILQNIVVGDGDIFEKDLKMEAAGNVTMGYVVQLPVLPKDFRSIFTITPKPTKKTRKH